MGQIALVNGTVNRPPISCDMFDKLRKGFEGDGDIDGDHIPDLVQVDPKQPSLMRITLGSVSYQGAKEQPVAVDYKFTGQPLTVELEGNAYNATLEDYNGDGSLDFVYYLMSSKANGDCTLEKRLKVNYPQIATAPESLPPSRRPAPSPAGEEGTSPPERTDGDPRSLPQKQASVWDRLRQPMLRFAETSALRSFKSPL